MTTPSNFFGVEQQLFDSYECNNEQEQEEDSEENDETSEEMLQTDLLNACHNHRVNAELKRRRLRRTARTRLNRHIGGGGRPAATTTKKRRKTQGVFWTDMNGVQHLVLPRQSWWFNAYVANPNLESESFHRKFRLRFRLPYAQYLELVLMLEADDSFSRWQTDSCQGQSCSNLTSSLDGTTISRTWVDI